MPILSAQATARHCASNNRISVFSLFLLFSFVARCAQLPTAPVLEVGYEDYDNPTGVLDPTTINDAWLQLNAISLYSAFLPSLGFLEDSVFGPLGSDDGQLLTQYIGRGYANIDAICPGFDEEAPVDEALQGTLTAQLKWKNALRDGEAWGQSLNCQFRAGDNDVGFITGPFAIKQRGNQAIIWLDTLIQFGEVEVPGLQESAAFSFNMRLSPTKVERLIEIDGQRFVYYRNLDPEVGGPAEGIVDSRQTWGCRLDQLTCFNEEGGALSVTPEG